MKVLHVTESFGGGVTSAINTYVKHSPQYEHCLFASVRGGDATGEEMEGEFSEVFLVPRAISSLWRLRSVIKRLKPDVIHLHSAFAGFLVRGLPFSSSHKIVYTPHAFPFLRNQSAFLLGLYRSVESILATRTQVIAGCGRHEQLLAQQFKAPHFTTELINVCEDLSAFGHAQSSAELPVISMVGRVCEQKDYRFFARVASGFKGFAIFKWIGGGDPEGVALLEASGVVVTGWVERNQVIPQLLASTLYFHSAAWDGFPISVLEAAELNIPVLLREIGPFTAEGLDVVADEESAVKEVVGFLSGGDAYARCVANTHAIRRDHTSERLSQALSELYDGFETK